LTGVFDLSTTCLSASSNSNRNFGIDFVWGVNANRRLRIYSDEPNKEIPAFFKGQPRRELLLVLPVLVNIEDQCKELVFGWGLRKLLNKRAQNALGISATLLGSIAVEVRQVGFSCWIAKEPVNDQ